jgi:preprotein translocase subunit YajC
MYGPPCTADFLRAEMRRMTPSDWRPRPLSIGRSVIVSEPPKPDGLLGKVVEIAVDMKGETTVVVSLDDGTQVTVERRCVRPTGES